MPLSKSVLEGCERMLFICEAQNMAADYVFHELTGNTSERNRPVVAWAVHISLLIDWGDNGLGPVCWYGATFQSLVEEGCEWRSQDVCQFFQDKVG